jgi:hypothetical protein
LKYEDLVTQPEANIRRLMSFLGLDIEATQLDESVYGNDRRANRVAFRKIGQPITPSSVGRYALAMTSSMLSDFEREAGDMLIKFGYSVRGDSPG